MVGRKADDRIHPQVSTVGFCFVFPLRVTFASYVLQVDLISSKNRELEHLMCCPPSMLGKDSNHQRCSQDVFQQEDRG